MDPQLDALRFLPFIAEATAMLGTTRLLKRRMNPSYSFGGRYLRSLGASLISLPVALLSVLIFGFGASLIYQAAGGSYENFSGAHLASFMLGTLGRAIFVWPFISVWLIIKAEPATWKMTQVNPEQLPIPALSANKTNPSEMMHFHASRQHVFGIFQKPSKFLLTWVAVMALAAGAAYAFLLYPIHKAERTKLRWVGELFVHSPMAWDLKEASGLITPDFEIDCSKPKYGAGWLGKLETARSLNYWSKRADAAEQAFTQFDDEGKPKAAAIAARDAVQFWSQAWYRSEELECYDVTSLNSKRPY